MYGIMVATVDSKRPNEVFWSTVKNTDGTEWLTDSIETVKTRYQELLQDTPASKLKPVHILDVEMLINIKGCEEEVPPETTPDAPVEPPVTGDTTQGGSE